jgi:hypothetical protein
MNSLLINRTTIPQSFYRQMHIPLAQMGHLQPLPTDIFPILSTLHLLQYRLMDIYYHACVTHSSYYSGITSYRHHGNIDALRYDAFMCYQTTVNYSLHNAGLRMLSAVYAFVCFEITLPIEGFITHVTAIWTFSTVYALMCVQITFSIEGFMTNITQIWTLSTMYAFMGFQIRLS